MSKDYRLPDDKMKELIGYVPIPTHDIWKVVDAQIADLLKEVPVGKLKEEIAKVVSIMHGEDKTPCSFCCKIAEKLLPVYQRFAKPLIAQARKEGQEEVFVYLDNDAPRFSQAYRQALQDKGDSLGSVKYKQIGNRIFPQGTNQTFTGKKVGDAKQSKAK